MKFDAGDEFSARNDTLQVNYASSEYLSSSAAQLPRQNPSEMMNKLLHDPTLVSHILVGILRKRNKPAKSHSLNISLTSEK